VIRHPEARVPRDRLFNLGAVLQQFCANLFEKPDALTKLRQLDLPLRNG
jgi:hypothetical protein